MKKKLLLLILNSAFLILHSSAQAPNWQWVVSPTGTDDIETHSVITDGFGNVYVAGWYYNTALTIGSFALPFSADGDVFVAKYDSNGNALWLRGATGSGFDEPRSIATDASGNVYVTGLFDGPTVTFGSIILTNASATLDVFVTKYDSSGNVTWAHSIGGINREFSEQVTVDYAGDVYVSGSFESATLSIGSTTLVNAGSPTEDVYIAKYDSGGNALWARSGSGSGLDWATCVTTDAFGNAFIAGPFYSPSISFGAATLVNATGNEQMFIVKYDFSGNVLWARQAVGNNYFNELYSLATDAFGNIFTVGSTVSDTVTFGSLVLTNPVAGYFDMIVAKYDSGGTVLWARKPGGNSTDYGYSVTVDASGNAYVAGYYTSDTLYFDSLSSIIINPNYYSDLFVVKYNPGGTVDWAKGTGGIYQPLSYGYSQLGIASNASGDVYVAGCFNYDSLAFDSDILLLNGCTINIFLAKLNDAGACSASFDLFPDSTTQHLYWAVNQATGTPPLSYNWNWGDNTNDTVPYPSHTYAVGGFYPVCLTITDSTGCTNTVCHSYLLQVAPNSPQSVNTMVYVNVVSSWPVGIEENREMPDVQLYPNPAANEFTIYDLRFTISGVEIYNVIGEKMFGQQLRSNRQQVSVNVSEFIPGIYFVKVKGEGQERVVKFVKQ